MLIGQVPISTSAEVIMKLNNLKVYCVIEEDQDTMVEVIREMDSECKISTWEPDGDDENPGTWGMFVDDFPAELYDKIVDWLESENSWCLIRDVEMSLDDEDANIYKEYIAQN